ncbi:MAG TPA: sigma factor [Thermoanaerobaculia bacterium]|jgi:DNA-directed RNA polymerase specialized sigma24 family protein|nr:sigma factor [Thermoanaerobaculia bacterium]
MQALADLYDRYAPQLYAIALRITNDRDAAADALESAFVSLSRNADAVDPAAYLIRATRDCALARQTRPASATVVVEEPSARSLVEDAWYNGMTVSDLATRYGISEAKARGMLCDGMAELRMKFAAGTK